MTLYQFLQAQVTRDDAIGDLARDAAEDRSFPCRAKAFRAVERYLRDRDACDGALEACKKACAELTKCNRYLAKHEVSE